MIFSMSMIASADSPVSWYTVPTKDGTQPVEYPAKEYLDKYDTIYLGDGSKKRIYLTFDAGYENGNIEKILDTMKKHNVKGAFFVLPHLIKSNPELMQRISDDGHLVCNHSYSHKDMSKITNKAEFEKELRSLEELYRDLTGREMAKFYRPPEGRFSESNLKFAHDLGYKTVFWSLAYADWDNNKQIYPEKAKNILISRIHNGAVILLHPTSSTNALILDDVITELTSKGYEFGTIDEITK